MSEIRPKFVGKSVLAIDPKPTFGLSPYLYMQFMEPLGSTDSSVEAGWDFTRHCWREDFVEVTQELAPPLIRWPGGCLSSYYRWKEAIGPRDKRRPLLNMCWNGMETNQIGTDEFMDFCQRVDTDPLISINFESDGKKYWIRTPDGDLRSGGPEEAAEWIDYCNNPANAERIANGSKEPFDVRLWQIGNETSYGTDAFDCETAAQRTLVFAKAMREVDPDIKLIGWGDSGWARRMLEVSGEELQYMAVHHHFNSGLENSPLKGTEYRRDPELTWKHLMNACKSTDARIQQMREEMSGHDMPLALTEGHFGLPGRNRCEVLSSWAAGVANARILNVHARNGDFVKIATLADFCGTRWMVSAIMIPVPYGRPYMMPVARVMALYRHHVGEKSVGITSSPGDLDVTASRTGNTVYLHAININRTQSVDANLQVEGMKIDSGRVFQIACDPTEEIDETRPDLFDPEEYALTDDASWQFPPASVTAIELDVRN